MCEGPSRISGPIPPDVSLFPHFYKHPASARGRLEGNSDGVSLLDFCPFAPDPSVTHRPRISQSAAHILERGRGGVVAELLRLDANPPTPTSKQKQKVPDFGRENIRRLREIQKRCREQEAVPSRSTPVKALAKYNDVPSRLMEGSSSSVKPHCQNFLKAHAKAPPTSGRCSGNDLDLKIQGQGINFIKHNARCAGKTAIRRATSLTNLRESPVPMAIKGQVPQYLEERKLQWRKEEEERRRNAPDPSVPAGHSLLSDAEKHQTLTSLKNAHRSLVAELLSLPLKTDTLSTRSRRAQLDCRLSEIEEGIKIFSRDKVYIKNDS